MTSVGTEVAIYARYRSDRQGTLKAIFDTGEASPLSEEQADACLCMDDAVQSVAGAGSGKTSEMVVKTGYVPQRTVTKLDRFLLVAFYAGGANEFRQPVRQRPKGIDVVERIVISSHTDPMIRSRASLRLGLPWLANSAAGESRLHGTYPAPHSSAANRSAWLYHERYRDRAVGSRPPDGAPSSGGAPPRDAEEADLFAEIKENHRC